MIGKKGKGTALAPHVEPGMTRWTPWQEMTDLRQQMDNLLSRPFGYTPLSQFIPSGNFEYEPPVDIYTTDDKVFLYATLPGFTLDSIFVEATPEEITLHGERKALYDQDKAVPEQQSGTMGESRFRIQCTLPAEIDPNKIKATFRNGILELEMPRTDQAKTKTVKVAVKAA